MVDVSRECCERYFGMDDELFDYTMEIGRAHV